MPRELGALCAPRHRYLVYPTEESASGEWAAPTKSLLTDRKATIVQINNVLAGMAVGDLDRAANFYSRLFDRPSQEPMGGLIQWDL